MMDGSENQVMEMTIVSSDSRLSIIPPSSQRKSQQKLVRKGFKILLWVTIPTILIAILIPTIYYVSEVHGLKSKNSNPEKCPLANAYAFQTQNRTNATENFDSTNKCRFSPEARRIKLETFFGKVKESYYNLFPQNIWSKRVSLSELKARYRPFDARPFAIKKKTDSAKQLLQELESIQKSSNEEALSEREKKGIHEAKHFLQHAFGTPYAGNYYNGDWLLGPNIFCWEEICYLLNNFQVGLYKPMTLDEVEKLRQVLQHFQQTILQYIENLKTGVKSGMVRSIEACEAGLNAIKRRYPSVIHKETGIRRNTVAAIILDPQFTGQLSSTVKIVWSQKHGENLTQSLDRFVVEYLGRPLHTLISYLEHEHMRHCVPSNVSSGLANLPLPYVYVDGKPDRSQPTNQTLPSGEVLQGPKLYRGIMSYFTAKSITPDEIAKQANAQLKQLYKEAVEFAKETTGKTNEADAVKAIRKLINSRKMFFNGETFPTNESNETAFEKCSSVAGARLFCPKRWEAMEKWIASATETMDHVTAKISQSLFYLTGRKRTLPRCSVVVKPDFNPSVSYHHYWPCPGGPSSRAIHYLPFFIDNYGPRYSEWTTTAHETLPGHHMEVQGYTDNFQDNCHDNITWLGRLTYYASYSEGWATYAESPVIARDTDSYINKTMSKYGMINHQIMAVLRAIIDVGLHSKGMTRAEALQLFDKYAWETSDLAAKEITRYQSSPGQATAYTVGQSTIIKARKLAENCLGKAFSLPEFHYQVLRQGDVPLEYLQQNINKFIHCTLDKTSSNCRNGRKEVSSLSQSEHVSETRLRRKC